MFLMWINEGRTNMKKIGVLLLTIIAAIGLIGCSKKSNVYEYGGKEYTVDVSADTVSDGKNTYYYSFISYEDTKKIEIVYPNQSRWTKKITDGFGSESYTDERVKWSYIPGEELYNFIDEAEAEYENGGVSPKKIIFGIIGVGVCMIPIIAPYKCWELYHGWKFRDAEPSDAYIALTRVFGILLAIAWVVIVILIRE